MASTVFGLVSVADGSVPTCASSDGNAVTVTVNSPAATAQTIAICEGENVVVGGLRKLPPGFTRMR